MDSTEMTFLLRLPMIVGACSAALLGACSGVDDPAEPTVSYSAEPSSAPTDLTPSPGIDDDSVALVEGVCYSNDGESLNGLHPADWDVEPNGPGRCSWTDPRDGTLEFVYDGDVPGDEVWTNVLTEHNDAGLPSSGEIPGYEFIQVTRADASGNPLWHYQYIDDRGGGSTYLDSYNLYRGQWRITYEAESSRYNEYIAERLEAKVDVGP